MHVVFSAIWARRWGTGAALGLPLSCACYDYAAQCYAQMILGAAATEQLWMQRLEGTVELELVIKPLSNIGELRGLLSPVLDAPQVPQHLQGIMNHRAFTLLESSEIAGRSGLSSRTRERHAEINRNQLPPVVMRRAVGVYAPINLLSVLFGGCKDISLYCRKSRAHTEYFTVMPDGFSSGLVPRVTG